jgi:hypothetical protein
MIRGPRGRLIGRLQRRLSDSDIQAGDEAGGKAQPASAVAGAIA